MKRTTTLLSLLLAAPALCAFVAWRRAAPPAPQAAAKTLDSCIASFAGSKVVQNGPFGEFRQLLGGGTRSLDDLLVGACVLEPGQQIHPAHVHVDEEFLYVAKGEGTWHLNGKDSAAHEGDVLYVKPWDLHGITNTGKERLTFFVIKWNGHGLEKPAQPTPPGKSADGK
jgi:mannose-6-phosphate isomerase-like protein (cupin superfamily)